MIKKNETKLTIFLCLLALCLILFLTSCTPKIDSFTPKMGREGTEVTIKGKRFKNAPADNTVKFGDLQVPTSDIAYASETMIKARVTAGARTGRISITTAKGTGYSEGQFVVTDSTEWTFMVFLNADNNLEPAGIDDFLEMSSVGSSENVNIVVQMDRCPGYTSNYGDWTGTKRFLIEQEDTPSTRPIEDLGEKNMGDPAVLQSFVEWAITTFPAKHYALSIWDHGDGWRIMRESRLTNMTTRAAAPVTDWGVSKTISQDETDGYDVLYMKEVQTALETALANVESQTGVPIKLDIVGFDACLMGMVEVAYAIRNVADFMVGSEYLEPGDGWPYDAILAQMTADPSITPQQVAKLIVAEYVASYSGWSGITQSAYDMSKLDQLCAQIDYFVSVANVDWLKLKTARTNTVDYHSSGQTVWGVDLWHFADQVYNQATTVEIKNAAQQLRNAVEEFVIGEGHSPDFSGSNGAAIYFPPDQSTYYGDPEHSGYEENNTQYPVDFILDHSWDNWIKMFYSNI